MPIQHFCVQIAGMNKCRMRAGNRSKPLPRSPPPGDVRQDSTWNPTADSLASVTDFVNAIRACSGFVHGMRGQGHWIDRCWHRGVGIASRSGCVRGYRDIDLFLDETQE